MNKQYLKWTALGLVLIVFLVIGIATQRVIVFTNSFTEYKEHFNGSCQKIYGVRGGEDITIDDSGIAWISAYDRRAVIQGKPVRGKIYTLDLNAPTPRLVDRTPNMDRFYPHGISLLTAKNGVRYLFAVNHPTLDTHNIMRFRIGANNKLRFSKRFAAKNISSPNDLVAIAPNQFYYTNDLSSKRDTLMQLLEVILYLPWGNLGFFDGQEAKIIYDGLSFANGVNISKDGSQVYVAEAGGRRLNIFDRNKSTNVLTLNRVLPIPSGIDNLELDENGNLWTAAHPKPLLFGAHIEDNKNKAPSQVFQIFLNENRAEEIYYNKGEELSAAATAAPYKNKFLLGPVFDDHILLCQRR
jgi:arylesterase/paraoxonase